MISKRPVMALGLSTMLSLSLVSGVAVAQDADEAELAFCSSLVGLADAFSELDSIGAGSTVEEVEAAADGVAEATDAVRESAGDLAEAQVAQIEEAADALRGYGDTVSGDQTIAEVVRGHRAALAELRMAIVSAGSVSCDEAISDEVAAAAQAAASEIIAEVTAAAQEARESAREAAGEMMDEAQEMAEEAMDEAAEMMEEAAEEEESEG